MRIMSIVGARPQFVKLAAISRAVSRAAQRGVDLEDFIVHTGQHYDPGMSDVFFSELAIPSPNVDLEIGSGSHGVQTARMLEGIEELLVTQRPAAVVVYGDTNSTVAGALAAAKLHVPIVHVEAGLRSFNRRMPEEVNRVATDHMADLLLAPTPAAMRNLRTEGLESRSIVTGDVMLDAVQHALTLAALRSDVLQSLKLARAGFAMVTIHRADNTEPEVLAGLLQALNDLAAGGFQLVFPVHPRTQKVIDTALPDWRPAPGVRLIPPLGYLDTLQLLSSAKFVLTDSGGLQKEAFFVGCPCVTLREETEWVETVEAGGNVLAGSDPQRIRAAVDYWTRVPFNAAIAQERGGTSFGSGDAADRSVAAILEFLR